MTNLDRIFPRKHSYNGEVEYFFVIYSFSERTAFHFFFSQSKEFYYSAHLAPRSDDSESPPPPLSSPTFCFTSYSSDLVLYGGDLLEALGGSSLQRTPSLLSARLCLSSGRQDLLQLWMFGGHWIWGLIPIRDSIVYPTFGVDPSKLFFLKSPHHTRITWHILP